MDKVSTVKDVFYRIQKIYMEVFKIFYIVCQIKIDESFCMDDKTLIDKINKEIEVIKTSYSDIKKILENSENIIKRYRYEKAKIIEENRIICENIYYNKVIKSKNEILRIQSIIFGRFEFDKQSCIKTLYTFSTNFIDNNLKNIVY